ncbi:MarR family winged helix-turn-helix transcriptional regulator [Edaphobacter albus]|uniref:MarR family winged helix-turn-helix transcriptional regulator n=1 Tax=Edaphobacter sp. 4G125 TaxID=2763071 RepID=UPI00164646C6|nr:MarR family transcriptional regulator [Edaphobacter sp. 4G125]QNI38117.1 MarR family transcriptional regulator [Edaphobacter sp. 4G125]
MTLAKKQRATGQSERLGDLAEFRYRLRRFLSFSEVAAEEADISAQQYQLMQAVAMVPEGQGCSISYLAERMVLRHNSAVELVDRAERSGLVRRVADENDHRRSLVELTERGSKTLATLVDAHLLKIEAEGPEMVRALQRLIGGRNTAKKSGAR